MFRVEGLSTTVKIRSLWSTVGLMSLTPGPPSAEGLDPGDATSAIYPETPISLDE